MRGLRLASVVVLGLSAVVLAEDANAGNLVIAGGNSHAFGTHPVFSGSTPATLMLSGTGSDTQIEGLTFSCGEFTAVAIHPGNLMPINAGNTFDLNNDGTQIAINLTYDPADRAADSCTVTIENDGASGHTTFTMTGDGSAAELQVTPSPHDFSGSRVNTSAALPFQAFTVTNIGELAATVTPSITMGGSAYSVGTTPFVVGASNGTGIATVTFDAVTPGLVNGTLQLSAPSSFPTSPLTVALSGTGTIANLVLPAGPINLGSTPLGTPTSSTNVSITNPGPTATNGLTITNLALSNAEFEFTGNGCSGQSCAPADTIAVDGTELYPIRCTPTMNGLRTATLTVTSNDFVAATPSQASTTATVTVQCTGVQGTIVHTTPAAFGNQRVGTTSGPLSFTVSNPSGASSYTFNAAVTGDFALACPLGGSACFTNNTVDGGEMVTVQVVFAPTMSGNRTGTVTITAPAAANNPQSFGVSGTGTQPTISAATSVAFMDVPVLLAGGALRPLPISNTGNETLTVSTMVITGTTDISFAFGTCTSGQICNGPFSINNGTPLATQLRCDPSATGPRNGSLAITSDSNAIAQTTVTNVTLTCNGTQANVVVMPTTIPFGPQRLNLASGAMSFQVTNPAGTNIGATNYTITSSSPEFVVSCVPGDCNNDTLNPNGLVTVNVVFTPSALGVRSGVITVNTPFDPTPNRTVSVTGEGVVPIITLTMPSPPPLAFTNIQPGQTSAAQTIQIQNTGGQQLMITAVNNDNTVDFDLSPGGLGNVGINGFQQWTVTCSPADLGTGTKTGRITIVNDSQNDTSLDIDLTCSVIQGRIVISMAAPRPYESGPNRIDFGIVVLGNMVSTTVTITNVGNQPVNLGTPSVAAADQGFTVGALSGAVVAASASVTLPVTFAPTLNSQGMTTLTIPSTNGWNTITVNLIGDGQNVGLDLSPQPTPPATAIDLGPVTWDATAARVFTITNFGQLAAPITSATLLNNAGGNYTLSGFAARTLAFNENMPLTVTATPNDLMLGTFTTTLEVVVNLAPPNDRLRVDITYNSTGPGIEIVSGSVVNFGGVDLDTPGGRTLQVMVRNPGTSALPIAGIGAITGVNAAEFEVVIPTPPGPPLPPTIAPGATATFMINYEPSVERPMGDPDTASVVINTGAYFVNGVQQPGGQTLQLSGFGTDRHIDVPAALAFGDVYRHPNDNDPKATRVARVCNTGAAVLDVTMVTGDAEPFAVTSAESFMVAGATAGESCVDVTVEFRPLAYGDFSDTLMVTNNDDGNPIAMIPLSGRGIARPVTIAPDSLATRARIAVGVPVRLTEIIAAGIQAANPTTTETFRIRLELDDSTDTANLVGTVATEIAPSVTALYDLELVAKAAGDLTVTVNVFLDDDELAHDTVTIDLTGVEVDVGGGVGCDSGGGRGGWLVLVLGALGLGLVRRRRAGAALAGLAIALAVIGAATTAQAQVSREIELGTFHVTPATETAMFAVETPQIDARRVGGRPVGEPRGQRAHREGRHGRDRAGQRSDPVRARLRVRGARSPRARRAPAGDAAERRDERHLRPEAGVGHGDRRRRDRREARAGELAEARPGARRRGHDPDRQG